MALIRVSLASLVCSMCALACAPGPASKSASSPAPVAAPVAAPPAPPFGPATLDRMLRAEWQKQGITPAPRVSDARFLRRAYLDIVGTIPPADAVAVFESDASPDKRRALVTTLLASPRYAEHWAVYWDDVLMGKAAREPRVDRASFRGWLRDQFAANASWSKIVYGLVSATGQNSPGGSQRGSAYGFRGADAPSDAQESINPAVNWILKYADAPQDFAGSASKTFLGVQIQCAQCHDHKTEAWKQEDFQRFASCFTRTQLVPIDRGNVMGNIRRVVVSDAPRVGPRFAKNPELAPIAAARPATLDGVDLSATPNARDAIAKWITAAENPWFTQAIVNRMWAHFLGRGFVDPVDDLRASNPATAPEILKKLATELAAHGYDLKFLVATIAGTEAYQLEASGGTAPSADAAHKTWARFRLAPMGAEELLNSLLAATNLEGAIRESKANLEAIRQQLTRQYAFLFDVDEEIDHDAFEGTLAQALTLLNGSLTGSASTLLPGSALSDVLEHSPPGWGDRERVESLYLRTLSRRPTTDETAYWTRFVNEPDPGALAVAPGRARSKLRAAADPLRRLETKPRTAEEDPKTRAYEDMLWALLNSSEFLFNH